MKLLALRCPSCAQPLKPQSPEVVVLHCGNCGTAVSISDAGLDTIAIQFAAPAVERIDAWVPLWVFDGQVNIQSRQTQGGDRQAKRDAEQLWGYPRRFYIPAWDLPMETACRMGSNLVQQQIAFQPFTPPDEVSLVEAITTPDDALKMMEFVVLNVEAARKDWLKDLRFTIEVTSTQLWAVPAQKIGDDLIIQPLVT